MASLSLSGRQFTVEFSGLKRTQPSYLLDQCGLDEADSRIKLTAQLLTNIRQQLYRTGLFSEVTVKFEKPSDKTDAAKIKITVKEKWAFIPIPFVMTSGTRIAGGAFLLDANFLGRAKKLFAGITGSKDGLNGMAGYIDDRLFGSRFTVSFFSSYLKTLFESNSADGTSLLAVDINKLSVLLGVGYRWGGGLRTSLKTGLLSLSVDDSSFTDTVTGPLFVHGVELVWERLRFSPFFQEGVNARIELQRFVNGDEQWNLGRFNIKLSGRLGGVHRFTLTFTGHAGDLPHLYSRPVGGRPGMRSLPPQQFRSKAHLAMDGGYELPLFHSKKMLGAVFLFGEGGRFRGYDGALLNYSGAGAGFNLYLKRLALPALGFYGAYNFTVKELQWSFSLGMSFF